MLGTGYIQGNGNKWFLLSKKKRLKETDIKLIDRQSRLDA